MKKTEEKASYPRFLGSRKRGIVGRPTMKLRQHCGPTFDKPGVLVLRKLEAWKGPAFPDLNSTSRTSGGANDVKIISSLHLVKKLTWREQSTFELSADVERRSKVCGWRVAGYTRSGSCFYVLQMFVGLSNSRKLLNAPRQKRFRSYWRVIHPSKRSV